MRLLANCTSGKTRVANTYEVQSWVPVIASEHLDDTQYLEVNMKKLALAAALSVAASSAFAGGIVVPVMEPVVVEAQTSSSSAGIIVPLMLLLVVAAVASN